MIDAVIFDLDGVLLQSEELWDQTREAFARETGGAWRPGAQHAMMGMNTAEWSRYMRDAVGVPLPPERIAAEVTDRLAARYRAHLPLIPGARDAVLALAPRYALAVASSSPRALIALVLQLAGLDAAFGAFVSSEEVPRGKPAPDVYLEAARRIAVAPARAAAVEDSHNGLLAARAAGLRVVAVPNPAFPPAADALAVADVTLATIRELTPERVDALAAG